MTEIIKGRLWLGNKNDVKKMAKKMTLVVNCTSHLPTSACEKNIRLPVYDPGPDCVPSQYIQKKYIRLAPKIVKEIHREIGRGGKVLVHCHVGAQRSAALVLLYLVLYGKWASAGHVTTKDKYERAKEYIIGKRDIAFFGGEYMSFECAVKKILQI
jgi:hypothetical protein